MKGNTRIILTHNFSVFCKPKYHTHESKILLFCVTTLYMSRIYALVKFLLFVGGYMQISLPLILLNGKELLLFLISKPEANKFTIKKDVTLKEIFLVFMRLTDAKINI